MEMEMEKEKNGGERLQNGSHARVVDLRSDTVTRPTAAMRSAMAAAEVDDDILGADPTTQKLQCHVAELFGKEAALFVPSGTMGNLISVLVHCEVRGSEVILGSESHIFLFEQGGISTLGNVHPHTVPNERDGTMDLKKVEAAIRPFNDDLFPNTSLICIENTHGSSGGRCLSVEYTDKIGELAKQHGLKLHIDGARIFNASTALGVSPKRLVKAADSVSICFSKGLGAPAGTVIVGSYDFILKAKRLRKALGGAMRQVGVLAAPCLVGLNDIAGRLQYDHQNARALAEGLNKLAGLRVDMSSVESNMVIMDVLEESTFSGEELCNMLGAKGIYFLTLEKNKVRLVTHHQISSEDINYALSCFQDILMAKKNQNGTIFEARIIANRVGYAGSGQKVLV